MKLYSVLLFIFFFHSAHAEPVIFCDVSKGLELINQATYSELQIEKILVDCDKVLPDDLSVLLLHGLNARKQALQTKQYATAIEWLEKAHNAAPRNVAITLELASTYEMANNLSKASQIYQLVLLQSPQNRTSLLGQARIFRLQDQLNQATGIYKNLLMHNPYDVDAINGLAWIKAAEKDLTSANNYFQETLKIQPENQEALLGLKKIKQTQEQALGANPLCDAMKGLIMLNQEHPPLDKINSILQLCANNQITNTDTLLLRGLLARKEAAETNKHYKTAISWLKKAMKLAENKNLAPAFELATTYEWAAQPKESQLIYQHILSQDKMNRTALLGLARTCRMMSQWNQASSIYHQLLTNNAKDVDALIGLGWIELAKSRFDSATRYFTDSLTIQPLNEEAKLALKKVAEAKQHPAPPLLSAADRGLILLNQKNPPLDKIQVLLRYADAHEPNSTSTLMLHGLLARYFKDYKPAILWLRRAVQTAKPGNFKPALELALTYEWASELKSALYVYQEILFKKPNEQSALLGRARVLRASYQISQSKAIYQQLLNQSPEDVDVLNGYGETLLANYEFKQAREVFNDVLTLSPENKQTAKDLEILNKATKNILGLTGGHYSVPPQSADGINLFYFRNLNASDGLTLFATHNTKQIESGFGVGPTLLPNNSLLLGYQRIIPQKYNWQFSYDARQHNGLPFEHRAFGLGGLFLHPNLEWFNGFRLISPKPWNTRLYISGLTAYTSLPANVTVTGFWTEQQIGGYSSSYVLDLSKEFSNRFFYDLGTSYLPQQQNSWEVHGKLLLPIVRNLALVTEVSHYFFNDSTFITAGWRIYWA